MSSISLGFIENNYASFKSFCCLGPVWLQLPNHHVMAGWNHRCNEHELGQTPGDGERQGGLEYCRPRGHKESDVTGGLNTTTQAFIRLFIFHPLGKQSIVGTTSQALLETEQDMALPSRYSQSSGGDNHVNRQRQYGKIHAKEEAHSGEPDLAVREGFLEVAALRDKQ